MPVGTLQSLWQMKIGEPVLHHGRLYVLRGLDPMSVPDRTVLLEEIDSGQLTRAPFSDVESVATSPEFESEGLG